MANYSGLILSYNTIYEVPFSFRVNTMLASLTLMKYFPDNRYFQTIDLKEGLWEIIETCEISTFNYSSATPPIKNKKLALKLLTPIYLHPKFCFSQKMKFSIKDFFSKCDQILRKMWIWSYLLKKSLMENLIF